MYSSFENPNDIPRVSYLHVWSDWSVFWMPLSFHKGYNMESDINYYKMLLNQLTNQISGI